MWTSFTETLNGSTARAQLSVNAAELAIQRLTIYGGFDLQQPTTFWKREIFQKVGGMAPSSFYFAFDSYFFRFIRDGARFSHIPRLMAAPYRIHPTSKSSTERKRCEESK